MNLIANQIKYGQIKAVNFIIDQLNHGYKIIIQKGIQYIMKELLIESDVAERFIRTLKPKFINT